MSEDSWMMRRQQDYERRLGGVIPIVRQPDVAACRVTRERWAAEYLEPLVTEMLGAAQLRDAAWEEAVREGWGWTRTWVSADGRPVVSKVELAEVLWTVS